LRYRPYVGQESGRRPKFDPDQREARGSDTQDEHRSFNLTVGEAIRRARQEHGWTQAFLAEQAGLSPNYIARLERGELGPSLFVANRICDALTMALEVLVTRGEGAAATGSVAPMPGRRTTSRRRAIAG
jgi:ribosome-binding protein aMBF1 (putative translation factor)